MNLEVLTLTPCIFDTGLGTGSYSSSFEALRYGKDESRGQSCGSPLNIHQDILKSGNLLHKQGFVDSQ